MCRMWNVVQKNIIYSIFIFESLDLFQQMASLAHVPFIYVD